MSESRLFSVKMRASRGGEHVSGAERIVSPSATMDTAAALVRRFDAAPDYSVRNTRFTSAEAGANAHDGLGATARASAETLIRYLKNEALTALWKECREHA